MISRLQQFAAQMHTYYQAIPQTAKDRLKTIYFRTVLGGSILGAACGGLKAKSIIEEHEKKGEPLTPIQKIWGTVGMVNAGATVGLWTTAAFPLTACWLSKPENREKLKTAF